MCIALEYYRQECLLTFHHWFRSSIVASPRNRWFVLVSWPVYYANMLILFVHFGKGATKRILLNDLKKSIPYLLYMHILWLACLKFQAQQAQPSTWMHDSTRQRPMWDKMVVYALKWTKVVGWMRNAALAGGWSWRKVVTTIYGLLLLRDPLLKVVNVGFTVTYRYFMIVPFKTTVHEDVIVVFFIEDSMWYGDGLICRRARVLPGVSFPSANADRFDDETADWSPWKGADKWVEYLKRKGV